MTSHTSLAFFLSLFAIFVGSQSLEFVYEGFNQKNITRDGSTILKSNGILELTNDTVNVIGRAFYPEPIQMFVRNNSATSSTRIVSSFSTHFVFQVVTSSANQGGHGLAFIIAPSTNFSGAQGDHYLGILSSSNNGNPSNHIFAVEFDTVNGHDQDLDSKGNHIGINNNSIKSIASEPAAYYVNDTAAKEEFELANGGSIQAWIDYDGVQKILNVTLSPPLKLEKRPSRPLMSQPIDLSYTLLDNMYVGFSAATGGKSSSHSILSWSFRMNGIAEPLPPESSSSQKTIKIALLVTLPFVFLSLLGIIVFAIWRRGKWSECPEDWELSCPHRFEYKDLYKATKGFKDSELLGAGGFGEVYKGVLPASGVEIAVKKISNNSAQGMREFSAEIESLGRLRHKHLVNLQGWCKRKNVLLLVYDYIPNGSLHSLLFGSKNEFLVSWEQRFKIIKGIASGLLYLHEDWEKVVIHRDVKSSNVLIDGDMNARLGDFGLARLHDHGKNSQTTNVVGTIGYIAPEFAQTGKASTRSDVYAFGTLILEMACGRGAIINDGSGGYMILVNWVLECHQSGAILDAADPKLGSNYVVEEMELILGLGLLCSHHKPEFRPSMRHVMRYLNGDEPLPVLDKLNSSSIGAPVSETSYGSSSVGQMSSTSLYIGR